MSTTYHGALALTDDSYRRSGLTHPAIIDAYVNRRINDDSLLTQPGGPRYADFFAGGN